MADTSVPEGVTLDPAPAGGPQPGSPEDWGANDPTVPAGVTLDAPPPAGYTVDPANDWGANDPAVKPAAPPFAPSQPFEVAPANPNVPFGRWGRSPYTYQPAPGGVLSPNAPFPPGVTPTEVAIDNSTTGRILDAMRQGARDGWGAEPLGLPTETEQTLRDLGLWNDYSKGDASVFKSFNESLMRPAAAALDFLFRRIPSADLSILTYGAGQVAEEAGILTPNNITGTTNAKDFGQGAAEQTNTLLAVTGAIPEALFMTGLPRDMAVADTLAVTKSEAEYFGTKVVAPSATPAVTLAPKAAAAATDFPASPFAQAAKAALQDAAEAPTSPVAPLPPAVNSLIDRAGNINLDRIAAPEDVKDVIRQVAEANGGYNEARRGVIPLPETEQLAYALGMTPDQLLKRNIGQAFNAEEATAARNLLIQSAANVRDLALKAANGDDTAKLAFVEAGLRHTAIQEQVAGMTAEAGRALSSFRIMSQGAKDAARLSEALKENGGIADIAKQAQLVSELDTPQQVSKYLMDARKVTTKDMLIEAWMNGLLSGPQTHVANALGNTITSLWRVGETGAAAVIGGARHLVTGADDRVMFGEVGAKLYGYLQGAKEGAGAAWRAFATETPSEGLSKLEQRKYQAIPGVAGSLIRIPGRTLLAADEFSKAIARRQAINALSYRTAAQAGLRGDSFLAKLAELRANPTDDILSQAKAEADYQTFTKPLGETGQAVQKFANSHPLAKMVIPFVRTPVNILKFAGERSPLGLFSSEVRDVLAGSKGAAARDEQIAKLSIGSAIGATMVAYAAQGKVTGGGPKDPAERAALQLTGWQPYSIKIGETYYSYARLEPISTLMGVAADGFEISHKIGDEDATKIAALVVASVSNNVLSKTWTKGVSDLVQVLDDPTRYGPRYLRQQIGTIIPAAAAQIVRAEDPYLRDAQTLLDTLKSRLPGLSQDVAPVRDLWGNAIKRGGAEGPDAISPLYTSALKNDPIARELINLGVFPAKPDRQIRGVQLTAKEYDDYQRVAGALLRYQLEQMMRLPTWGSIPPELRATLVTRGVDKTREVARQYVMLAHPEIMQAATAAKLKALGAEGE